MILSVDIGATKTVVAGYQDGEITRLDRFLTPADPEQEVEKIVSSVSAAGLTDKISAAGLGAPGPLDPERGVILNPPNLPGWKGFPLAESLHDALGVPVLLENDANVGALGEAIHGSGTGYRSLFYLTISTGIGSGIVVDGHIFGGHRGIAGEVWAIEPGHFTGDPTGDNLIERASGPGLIRTAKKLIAEGVQSELEAEALDTAALLSAADRGDPVAVRTLESGQNAMAGLVVSVLCILAPECVVLAGGLCTEPHWFVEPIRQKVSEWLSIPELTEIPIMRGALWDSAVLYGAAELGANRP